MEKEFVNYEIALELKELGFDESCLAWYGSKDMFEISGRYKNSTHTVGYCVSAPTFSQAFRWFREEYGLNHHIWSGKLNHIFYGYDILNIEEQEFVVNNSDIGGGDCDYDTYEEAELECLKKLIEIIKNK